MGVTIKLTLKWSCSLYSEIVKKRERYDEEKIDEERK